MCSSCFHATCCHLRKACCTTTAAAAAVAAAAVQMDLNLVGMGWLRLQRVLFRDTLPPAQAAAHLHTPQPAQQQQGPCGGEATAASWDPWNAQSAAYVAYERLSAQQAAMMPGQVSSLGSGGSGGGGGSGHRGSGGASALQSEDSSSSSSQQGSARVWDMGNIPPDWSWNVAGTPQQLGGRCACSSPCSSSGTKHMYPAALCLHVTQRSCVCHAAAHRPCHAPPRQTTCALEVDALACDVLNRNDALLVPLDAAGPDDQLVSSLAPMWAQERLRLGGGSIPAPPASPRRSVQQLSPAVEAVRQELLVREFTPCVDTTLPAHTSMLCCLLDEMMIDFCMYVCPIQPQGTDSSNPR